MNLKIKSYMLLLATLIIGIVIGIMVDRTFMNPRKVSKFARMRPQDRLSGIVFHVVRPEGSQIKAINKVLDDHSKRFAEIEQGARDDIAAAMDTLMADLKPILRDDQKQRLEETLNRLRNWNRRHIRPPQPPWEHRRSRNKDDRPM